MDDSISINQRQVSEHENALATRDLRSNGTIAKMLEGAGLASASTFDPLTSEGQLCAVLLASTEQTSIFDNRVKSVEAVQIVVQESESTNVSTGEVVSKLRTCFVDKDNNVFSCGSAVVARFALTLLMKLQLRGKLNPALTINFKVVPTRGGGNALIASCDPKQLVKLIGK